MSALHHSLLNWFDANQRDLPWRRTKDPYAIWVSEIMLQQTQVATVIPYFERWMRRFPSIEALAQAEEPEILALWQGLGYYRRARQLLAGARSIVETGRTSFLAPQPHQSAIESLLAVPGIGPYTAGAIASIAFNESVPLVDGNVERVYSRLTDDDSERTELKKRAWTWAEANVHPQRPGDWNQALMELGATICKPIDPRCGECPASSFCLAYERGNQNLRPTPIQKVKTISLTHHVWVPVCHGEFGLRQISQNQWWGGMWEFPREPEISVLEAKFPGTWPESAGSFRHSVTNHRIQVHVSLVRLSAFDPELTWVPREAIPQYALPSPQRKAFLLALRVL